jgi:hypothetical protein
MPATLRSGPEGTLPESSACEALGARAAMDAIAQAAAAIESMAFLIRSDSSRVFWPGLVERLAGFRFGGLR